MFGSFRFSVVFFFFFPLLHKFGSYATVSDEPSLRVLWQREPFKWIWLAGTILAVTAAIWSGRMINPEWWNSFPLPKEAPTIFNVHSLELYVHIFPSVLCLAIGPFQFLKLIRVKKIGIHRWIGRVYVVGVLVAAVTGFQLAFSSFGGPSALASFAILAILWFWSILLAYHAITQRKVLVHRNWMIRNFALSLFGLTFNVYNILAASVRKYVFGIDGDLENWEYVFISWVAWVPNLIIAEIHIRMNMPPANAAPPPPDVEKIFPMSESTPA